MTPHGPDTGSFEAAIREESERPCQQTSTLAFMFEVDAIPRVTPAALASPHIDRDYYKGWQGLRKHFTGRLCQDELGIQPAANQQTSISSATQQANSTLPNGS